MKSVLTWTYVMICLTFIFGTFLSPIVFAINASEPFYLLLFFVTPGLAYVVFALSMAGFIKFFE